MKRRYCQALDLADDPALIEEYQRYHREIWPEITGICVVMASQRWKFTGWATG